MTDTPSPPEARGPSRTFPIELARRVREENKARDRKVSEALAEMSPAGFYVFMSTLERQLRERR